MTNADKYLKDGVDVKEFAYKIYDAYINGKVNQSVFTTTAEWLKLETKPTLTEDEKVILRNSLESGADAIIRKDGGIYFHTKPGTKGIFDNIFQFIQPRRRI